MCVVLCFFSIEMVTFRFWWRCCHLPEAGVVTWVGRWVSRWVGVGQIVATSQLSGAGHTSFPGNWSLYSFYIFLSFYTLAHHNWVALVKLWSSPRLTIADPGQTGWGLWQVFDPLHGFVSSVNVATLLGGTGDISQCLLVVEWLRLVASVWSTAVVITISDCGDLSIGCRGHHSIQCDFLLHCAVADGETSEGSIWS